MALREDLYTVLSQGVVAVSQRVYPLIMPQDTQKASIVYTIIGDYENASIGGTVCTEDISIQVDAYGKTYAESLQIKEQAIAALRTYFNVSGLMTVEMYEDITLKYRQIISFRLLDYYEA